LAASALLSPAHYGERVASDLERIRCCALTACPAFLGGRFELLVRQDPDIRICGAPVARAEAQPLHVGGWLLASVVRKLLRVIVPRLFHAFCVVAEGKGPDTPVRDVMSGGVLFCFEDETLDAVSTKMGVLQVRRLPVLNRGKRLVGILSLGDISQAGDADGARCSAAALSGVSTPGGQHVQQ
jgi:CBS domain-containing protein